MTMCAKFFPCDEFDWLTEFVEYQTSEHQAKIKFTQGAQGSCEGRKTNCLHRRSLFFVPARKLLRQPRSQGSLLPVPTERETTGRRENLGTRLLLRLFPLSPASLRHKEVS